MLPPQQATSIGLFLLPTQKQREAIAAEILSQPGEVEWWSLTGDEVQRGFDDAVYVTDSIAREAGLYADDPAEVIALRDALIAGARHTAARQTAPKAAPVRQTDPKAAPVRQTDPKAAPVRPAGTPRQREVLAYIRGEHFTLAELQRAACYRSDRQALALAGRMQKRGLIAHEGTGFRKLAAGQVCAIGDDRSAPPRVQPWDGTTGPAGQVVDATGRSYHVRWRALPRRAIVASHDPQTGAATPGYPQALQARDRGAAGSLAQVRTMAAALDVDRLLAPSTSAADSAPIVWQSADDPDRWFVVSGNGRTMALSLATPAQRRTYLARARELFPGIHIAPGGLIVRELVGATFDDALQLAGASQGVATGALSALEQAASAARGLGVPNRRAFLDLGPFSWLAPIRSDSWRGWRQAHDAFARRLLERVEPSRRPTIEADPAEAADLVVDVLIGALPADAVRGGLGDRHAESALRGALPAIWTIERDIADGAVPASWSLLDALPEARRLYRSAGKKGIAALARDIDADARNLSMFDAGADVPELGDLSPLGVALGVALLRAGRRADSQAAAAEYLAQYVAAARSHDPRQAGLFGAADPGDPSGELGRIVRWVDPRQQRRRRNPRASYTPGPRDPNDRRTIDLEELIELQRAAAKAKASARRKRKGK